MYFVHAGKCPESHATTRRCSCVAQCSILTMWCSNSLHDFGQTKSLRGKFRENGLLAAIEKRARVTFRVCSPNVSTIVCTHSWTFVLECVQRLKFTRKHLTYWHAIASLHVHISCCQVSKRFDFCTSTSFGDPRLTLVHEDAAEFVKREVRRRGERFLWSGDRVRTCGECSSLPSSLAW